ncbi:MAG: FAD-binding domain-containing protein [Desulfuromonas sp.]|nr:FAD-binding domain-containing protein [Desulfuromonas sp.]
MSVHKITDYQKNHELQLLPHRYLCNQRQAPAQVLIDSKGKLGKNYTLPIVDLKASSNRVLEAYKNIRDQ